MDTTQRRASPHTPRHAPRVATSAAAGVLSTLSATPANRPPRPTPATGVVATTRSSSHAAMSPAALPLRGPPGATRTPAGAVLHSSTGSSSPEYRKRVSTYRREGPNAAEARRRVTGRRGASATVVRLSVETSTASLVLPLLAATDALPSARNASPEGGPASKEPSQSSEVGGTTTETSTGPRLVCKPSPRRPLSAATGTPIDSS